jgi:hypothetical protein
VVPEQELPESTLPLKHVTHALNRGDALAGAFAATK